MAQHAGTVIRDSVKHQNPVAVRVTRAHLPATQVSTVRRANFKILFGGSGASKHGGGLRVAHRIQVHGMQHAGADEVADHARQSRDNHQGRQGRNQPGQLFSGSIALATSFPYKYARRPADVARRSRLHLQESAYRSRRVRR